jgi:resuscitation-promoting factor RpfB
MAISAAAVAYCAVGGLVAYSGVKGATLSDTAQAVLKGNLSLSDTETVGAPASSGTAASETAASGNTTAANAGAAANQALAKQLATSMGFSSWTTGQEWSDWVSLWNQESGWNIDAANPTSSARGIAQNINGYGPDYLEGNATSQITWGINYIAQRYGSPSMAWAHEVEDNWY